MNDDQADSSPKQPRKETDALAIISVLLPLFGILFVVFGLSSSRNAGDFGRGALFGFLGWCALGLVGLVCAGVSISRHGSSGTAWCGLLLSASPLLLVLGTFVANS